MSKEGINVKKIEFQCKIGLRVYLERAESANWCSVLNAYKTDDSQQGGEKRNKYAFKNLIHY